jgi:hypothetical protein
VVEKVWVGILKILGHVQMVRLVAGLRFGAGGELMLASGLAQSKKGGQEMSGPTQSNADPSQPAAARDDKQLA